MKFRDKLILLTSISVVVTIAASMLIVGYTVREQNNEAISKQLISTFAVADAEINNLKDTTLRSSGRIVLAADLGAIIKFVGDYADFSVTRNNLEEMLRVIYNSARVNDFWQVAVYDSKGLLKAFLRRDKDNVYAGMVAGNEGKTMCRHITVAPGEGIPASGWKEEDKPPIDLALNLGSPPSENQVEYSSPDGGLGITTQILALANFFDTKADKMVKRPAGFAVFTRKINPSFVQRLKQYTQSEINIYAGGKMILGTLADQKTLSSGTGSQSGTLTELSGKKVAAVQVELDGQSYSAGILPLGPVDKPVAHLAAFYSNSIATANTMQMLQVLGIIALACIVVIIPITIYLARRMIMPLIQSIDVLDQGAREVAIGSDQALATVQQVTQSSSSQAASIEETAASVEEISATIKQNADNALQADQLMVRVNEVFKQADQAMDELTVSMQEISQASEQTSKIIKTIDEISFQTNLLALNAAVEAARAGEAGAGFAVVADEVRSLALRAAEAAKDTEDMIRSTVEKVGVGSELVDKTNDTFSEATDTASKVSTLVSEITKASSEQSDGISQINVAMNSMDQMVQDNVALTSESAQVSRKMSSMADEMLSEVRQLANLVLGKSKKSGKNGKRALPSRTGPGVGGRSSSGTKLIGG
jgi:ABC-type transporter Mla subunit MlaD